MVARSVTGVVVGIVMAVVAALTNDGCGPYISPADAYAQEIAGCAAKANKEDADCVKTLQTEKEVKECRDDAEWHYYQCKQGVNRRFHTYLGMGGYPSGNTPGFRR